MQDVVRRVTSYGHCILYANIILLNLWNILILMTQK